MGEFKIPIVRIQNPCRSEEERDEPESGGERTEAAGEIPEEAWDGLSSLAQALVERCRAALHRMHDEDKEEAEDLSDDIERAVDRRDTQALRQATEPLKDLLFFVEGR